MGKQSGKILLESRIAEGTNFQAGSDYILAFVKNKRNITEPSGDKFIPENWVFLRFNIGERNEIIEGKRSIILDFLQKENIEYFNDGNTYFVRIPNGEIKKVTGPEINTSPHKDPPEEVIKSFNRLKELHRMLPIYGVPNRDQPDLSKGIAYFNYFPDGYQAKKALEIFTEAKFGVEERTDKKHNLTFVLLTEGTDENKLQFGKGKPNGKTTQIFEWIIRKIYRKLLWKLSENVELGISERTTINVGTPEIFELQKSLEDDFNMIIHVHSTTNKDSEFYLLISDRAKNLYDQSERKISTCDLIQILKDPERETEIIQNKSKMKKMENLKLTKELINLLKESGFKTTPNKQKKVFIQVVDYKKDEYSSKVSIVYGEDQAESIAKNALEIILKKHPNARIKHGKGLGFYVSILGYNNIPKEGILSTRNSQTFDQSHNEEEKISLIPQTLEAKDFSESIPLNGETLEKKLREIINQKNFSDNVLETKDFSEGIILKREELEESLRALINKGKMNGRALKEAEAYLSAQEDNRKAFAILEKLKSLED